MFFLLMLKINYCSNHFMKTLYFTRKLDDFKTGALKLFKARSFFHHANKTRAPLDDTDKTRALTD